MTMSMEQIYQQFKHLLSQAAAAPTLNRYLLPEKTTHNNETVDAEWEIPYCCCEWPSHGVSLLFSPSHEDDTNVVVLDFEMRWLRSVYTLKFRVERASIEQFFRGFLGTYRLLIPSEEDCRAFIVTSTTTENTTAVVVLSTRNALMMAPLPPTRDASQWQLMDDSKLRGRFFTFNIQSTVPCHVYRDWRPQHYVMDRTWHGRYLPFDDELFTVSPSLPFRLTLVENRWSDLLSEFDAAQQMARCDATAC
jgi:hypothetical protein